MSAAHTPGPWTAHPPRGDDDEADGDKYHWVVRAPSTNGAISFQLCQISSMNRREDGYDARLISAAPDLLEALTMVRDADNDCIKDGLPTIPPAARSKIDAAIAKAVKP